MLDRDMRYLQVSDRCCADYSVDSSQVLGRSHYEIFPDIPERWKEIHRRALKGETLRADEDRWDREDGTTWVRWEIRPWITPRGDRRRDSDLRRGHYPPQTDGRGDLRYESKADRSAGARTCPDRERASRRHQPTTRNVGSRTRTTPRDNPSEVRSRVQELRKQTTEISNDVQALSHELHSSKLEYLGVVAGMKSWCKEFGERQGMRSTSRARKCRRLCHRKSGFAFFEFYKKPCTMPPSTAG